MFVIWDGRVVAHEKGSFACVELAALHGRRPDVVSTSPRNGSSGCQSDVVSTSYGRRLLTPLFTGLCVAGRRINVAWTSSEDSGSGAVTDGLSFFTSNGRRFNVAVRRSSGTGRLQPHPGMTRTLYGGRINVRTDGDCVPSSGQIERVMLNCYY